MPEPVGFKGRPAGQDTRRAVVVGVVLVAFIALATAKPWVSARPAPSPSPARSTTPVAVRPSRLVTAAPMPAPSAAGFGFIVGRPPTSTWASLTWTPVNPGLALGQVQSVVDWQHGFLAIGPDGSGGTPLWSSADGVAWHALPFDTPDGFWPGTRILAAVGFGGRLWAVGTVPMSASPSDSPASETTYLLPWTTTDGRSWQVLGATTIPTPLGLVGPVLAAASSDRLVLAWNELAPDGSTAARVWWSGDGSSWHQVERASLPAGFQISALVESPDGGFLGAGTATRAGVASAVLVHSPAGANWTPVSLPTDQIAAAGTAGSDVWALEPAAGAVLALGATDDPSGQALWWRSSDGLHWSSVASFWPLGRRPCPLGALTPGGAEGCGAHPNGVVGSDDGRIVALPADGSSRGWTSADARTWTPVESARGSMPASIGRLVVMPGGVLVNADGRLWYGAAS